MLDEVKAQKRPYRSVVREDAARRTRQVIVAAAAQLFAAHGYAWHVVSGGRGLR